MAKMGHTPRSLALHVDSHSAVPMTAADCYRRRMEGMRMHYGPAIPYTDDGYQMVAQVMQQALADVMGLPLRWLTLSEAEQHEAQAYFDGIMQSVESDDSLRNRTRVCWHQDAFGPFSRQTLETATGQALEDIARRYDLRRGPASRYAK